MSDVENPDDPSVDVDAVEEVTEVEGDVEDDEVPDDGV